jgi:hypothetical protein
MRFCRKKTGPGEVNRTAKPTIRKIGSSSGSIARTQKMSNDLFIPDCDQLLIRAWTNTEE